MIILNIAEWIINFLILGLSGLIWFLVIFGFAMILSVARRVIQEFTGNE